MNLNPIDQIEPFTIVATIVIFVVTYLLLRRFVFLPLVNVMEDRREVIEAGLTAAAEAEEILAEASAEGVARLGEAQAEAQRLVEQARERAARQSEARLKDAQREAQQLLDGGRAGLVQAREAEIARLRAEALQCVTLACEKLEVAVEGTTIEAVVDGVIAKRLH